MSTDEWFDAVAGRALLAVAVDDADKWLEEDCFGPVPVDALEALTAFVRIVLDRSAQQL